jgi:hypothetical protein
MTDAERQKRRYDRKKAGLVRIEVWVPADKADDVRKAVDGVVNQPTEWKYTTCGFRQDDDGAFRWFQNTVDSPREKP